MKRRTILKMLPGAVLAGAVPALPVNRALVEKHPEWVARVFVPSSWAHVPVFPTQEAAHRDLLPGCFYCLEGEGGIIRWV